jgi:phage terminase large subunit
MTVTADTAIRAIRTDPVAFCRQVLRFEPWSKQQRILESVRDHRRTAVRSCHGSGKTAVAARAAIWFLAAFPRSRVVTTAPTWSQVKEQLWREVATAHREARGFIDGKLTDTRLELGRDWFAIGLSTDRPERFQGHHAEHLLLIVDEASGVDERIFEAGEGFLTSPGARVLLIGNPTAMSGTFHRAFHAERAIWSTIAISAHETPPFTGEQVPEQVLRRLVSREWVEQAKRRWGEGSPLYEVRVLGQFPTQAEDTVIALAEVEAAQRRTVVPDIPLVVACDVARFGSDETAIAVREGDRVRVSRTYSGKDTMETAGLVLRAAREVAARRAGRPTIVVDDAGVGGGVTDRLRETSEYKVVAFNGAHTSHSREYPNKRSEAWFRFADLLPALDLDPDEQLAADLVAPRYSIDSRGRRVVEPKEQTKRRLGRSPDRADAVLMAFSLERAAGTSASFAGTTSFANLDAITPSARIGYGEVF